MKILASSQALYRERGLGGPGRTGYAPNLADLERVNFIDSVLAGGEKSGYRFLLVGAKTSWWAQASPAPMQEGRYFFTDQTGVIRFSTSGPAGPQSTPID